MQPQNPTYAYVGAFVDELARAGVQHVVICPGSRSTPLALSFAAETRIRAWVLIDERAAAFFALGLAKATRKPVALVCTSGTAAANFLPAVAEARQGRVPLLVLTADRPPELHDIGAPQTMDQQHLYGAHAKWFVNMALPEASDPLLRYARTVAGRAVATAVAPAAGPVHLNFPFREPLTPGPLAEQPLADQRTALSRNGRAGDLPFVQVAAAPRVASPETVRDLADLFQAVERGLIVVGPQDDPALPEHIVRLAQALGWPILADPLSQLRGLEREYVINNYDAFLRDDHFVRSFAPDLVLRFGAMPVSKPLLLFLQAHPDCRQVIVDDGDGWRDPLLVSAQMIHADPRRLIDAALDHLPAVRTGGWLGGWQRAAQKTQATLERAVRGFAEPFEGRVFSELAAMLPDPATLVVGNSMPIRDCDTFFAAANRAVRVLGNRGVNGIDGVVSTALGVAAAASDPVVLVLGDLSFYHDLNGLLAAKLHQLNLTIVLINNDGGGIFSFLPQAAYREHFEQVFGTPSGLDFQPVVEMYNGTFVRSADWEQFRTEIARGVTEGGLRVIEVRTDRERNVELHRQLWQAVGAELAAQREVDR